MATQKKEKEKEGSSFEGLPVGFLVRATLVSVFLGAYAAWITADLLPRGIPFVFVAVGVGGVLYRQRTQTEEGSVGLAYAGYVFAGLLVLTPVMMVLPDAVFADAYGGSVLGVFLMTMNLVYLAVFGLFGAVVAYVSYRA